MFRNRFFVAFGVAIFLTLANQASAQVVLPNPMPIPKIPIPNFDRLPPDLQRELQKALEQAQAAQFGRQPGGRVSGQMQWGGVRMEKAPADMQTDLGLGEKEGLVVLSVTPNSDGAKAGLKAKDVLIKFGDKSIPNDSTSFGMLVKDHKPGAPIDLVVIRDGKEETLKAAKMPTLVQSLDGIGAGRIGGGAFIIPRLQINPRFPNPLQPGTIQNLQLEMIVNGARIVRKQNNDQFSGEYSKDGLKITISGKIENGQAKPAEITVTEGKETKKYANLREVPAQHRSLIQQLVPSALNNSMLLPLNPNLLDLEGLLPAFPEFQQ